MANNFNEDAANGRPPKDSKTLLHSIVERRHSFSLVQARLLIRDLIHDGSINELVEIMEDLRDAALLDIILEAAVLEFKPSLSGHDGRLVCSVDLANVKINVMSFSVQPHPQGLAIRPSGLEKSEYSESLRDRIFEIVLDELRAAGEAEVIMRNSRIETDRAELSFLNGFEFERTSPSRIQRLLNTDAEKSVFIKFQKIGSELIIRAKIKGLIDKAHLSPVWNRVSRISEAGSSRAVILAPSMAIKNRSLPKPEPDVSEFELPIDLLHKLQFEIIGLGQSLEHARSVESALLKSKRGNPRLINGCLRGLESCTAMVEYIKHVNSIRMLKTLSLGIEEIFKVVPLGEPSANPLVNRQIDQLKLRELRVIEAFVELKDQALRQKDGK